MDGAGGRPGAIYRFDRFALDLDRGALLAANGTEVPLRPKSFAVLRLLVENAGRLLDHHAIAAAVWSGLFVSDESIAQCVKEIASVNVVEVLGAGEAATDQATLGGSCRVSGVAGGALSSAMPSACM